MEAQMLEDAVRRALSSCVLIVDDKEAEIVLAERVVRKFVPDAEILKASSGEQALIIFEKYLPWLIITDIIMPGGMRGTKLAKLILASRNDAFIILRSDSCNAKDLEIAANVSVFARKDIDNLELINALKVTTKRYAEKAPPSIRDYE